jgi:predicted dehydrogenase
VSKQYTSAIIGVGAAKGSGGVKGGGHQIGYLHAQTYQSTPRTRLIAAADINPRNLDAFQREFDVSLGFEDAVSMLREVRPDIVSICTYVGLHRSMIEQCAQVGVKGIFCEKPFLATPRELIEVERIARETGVRIVVGHFRRYLPVFQRARQLYAGGAVGEPMLCVAGIEGWDLSEWGSHWLDMFRHFHEDRPINWVLSQARVRDARGYGHAMEDHAVAYFEFDGGGKGLLDGGHSINGPWSISLIGTEGAIRIQGQEHLHVDTASGRKTENLEQEDQVITAWRRIVDELANWIEGGPEPLVGLPNILKSAELNLACYLSAIRGDRIDLPLAGQDTSDITEWPVEILARRAAQGQSGETKG